MIEPMTPTQQLKARALDLGFDAVGVAALSPLEAREHYEAWLSAGRHGEMAYLASKRHRERRSKPELILAGLCSVVCVALCYEPVSESARDERLGRIARYAVGSDYHDVMWEKLGVLEASVAHLLPGTRALGYSDTGAILERGWAQRAGLGWIGKNTCMIGPQLGSYFLLGELLVDHALDADVPFELDHCGTCTRCLDGCPTGAIVSPHQLDARLCISYLTIELRGPIPRELRSQMGDWIFGCDICQEVCPWNRFAPAARESRLHARALEGWTLERFLELDDAAFARLFKGSPIKRAKRAGFLRNVCVALGNRGRAASVPALTGALHDHEPLVRAHAAWALGEIGRRMPDWDSSPQRMVLAGALQDLVSDQQPALVRDEAAAALATLRPTRGGAE